MLSSDLIQQQISVINSLNTKDVDITSKQSINVPIKTNETRASYIFPSLFKLQKKKKIEFEQLR